MRFNPSKLALSKAREISLKHKDIFYNSMFLQWIYGNIFINLARNMAKQGKLFESIEYYCMAGRQCESFKKLLQIAQKECLLILNELICPHGKLINIEDNPFLRRFLNSSTCKKIKENALREGIDIVTLNGELLLLKKYNKITGEKGVLYLNFTFRQQQLLTFFDIKLLSQHYMLVIEPSWAGSMVPHYFNFIGNPFDVVIQSPLDKDIEFIKSLKNNLIPIKLGSCDWVDHNVFKPLPNVEKEYDLIMIANWAPWKGHKRLFKALRRIKTYNLRVVLIGYRHGNTTKENILRLLRKYGLEDSCEIFERLQQKEVNQLLNKSKVNILLSRREGANRSVFEAMMAGIPTILYKRNDSINHEYINRWTGKLADDHELSDIILEMVNNYQDYKPREWAIDNMGYLNATKKLNAVLKDLCSNNVWHTDIVPKVNSGLPNISYSSDEDKKKMKEGYEHLRTMLRK